MKPPQPDHAMNDAATTTTAAPAQTVQTLLADQPWRELQLGVQHITILGTAHVSKNSAETVAALLQTGSFDRVAIELCPARYGMLNNKDHWRSQDLFKLIREGRAGLMLANLVLSAYQQRLADQFGIEPGAEMRAAMRCADEMQLPVLLIDRDLGITMKRIWRGLGFWNRLLLFSGLFASVFSRESISAEEIEKLKEGDMLESAFAEFAQQSPALYQTLIDERDRYMAAAIQAGQVDTATLPGTDAAADTKTSDADPATHTLVVIGAGHMQGLHKHLQEHDAAPEASLARLNELPPPSRWPRLIPWILAVVVFTGFAIGFSRSPELGLSLLGTWVIFNAVFAALGAAIARGHPFTVLSALIASPLTSLNPMVAAGMVSASVEATLRKPTVADFESLRSDVTAVSGWWRNRVSRTLLVFVLTNLGSALGAWVAGFSILEQLLS
ncbi:MAG: TraB/GumN family protein [Wenzhouxiangellaceae bacterium]